MPRWSSNKAQGRGPRSPPAPLPLQPESQMAEPTATAVTVNVRAPASLSSTHRRAFNKQDPSPADAGSSSHDARIMQPGNLGARRPTLHEDILSVDIKPTNNCGTRLRRYNPTVYPPKPAHPLRKDRRLLVPQSSTSNDATNPNTSPDTDIQVSSSRPDTSNLTPVQLDDVHDVLCKSLEIYERLLTHPWEKNCKACHRLRAFFVRNYEHSQAVELKMAKDICSSRGCTGCASCTRTSNGQNGAGGTESTAESGRSAKAQTSSPIHPSSPSRSPQVPDSELPSPDAQERQNDGDILNQPGTKPMNATQNQPNNGDAGADNDNDAQVVDETVNNTATGFSGSWFAPRVLPGQPSSHTSPPNAVPVGQEGPVETVNQNPSDKRPRFHGVLDETRILDPRKTNKAVNVPSESGIDSAATDSAPMPAPAGETSSALASDVPVPESQTHDSPADPSPSEDFRQITDSALVSIGSPKIRNRRWSRKGSKQRKQDENRDPNADGSGSDDGKGDMA